MAPKVLRNTGRAPRVLLWAAAIFMLTQFAVGLFLDRCWLEVRFPEGAKSLSGLQSLKAAPDIVCLGSSRMGMAFRPKDVKNRLTEVTGDSSIQVFNAAVSGGDLLNAAFLLERILTQGKQPSVLVLEVTPETLGRYNLWFERDWRQFVKWSDLPRFQRDIRYMIGQQFQHQKVIDWLSSRILPLFFFRKPLREKLCDTLQSAPGRDAGSLPMTGVDWDSVYARMGNYPTILERGSGEFDELIVVQKWLRNYRLGGSSTAALESILNRCNDLHIAVVLVGIPLSSPYRKCYTREMDVAFRTYLNQVTAIYSCRFVDYRELLPDQFFWDAYHVVRTGGETFSRRLAEDCLAPVWRQQRGRRPL